MTTNRNPIGVFDSGLGGLTVVKEMLKILPKEDIVYLGDTARVPYGTRSKEIVTNFAVEDTKFLLERGVKCIVIACNTVSAFSYKYLKDRFKVPIFDVITPASKAACRKTKNCRIGVIGTRGTIESKAYDLELGKYNNKIRVFSEACPLFVPLIEEGEIEGKIIKTVVKKYLNYFKDKSIDTLILGCTHYPVIFKEIVAYLGKGIDYIDCGVETTKELRKYLVESKLLNKKEANGKVDYFVTDINSRFIKTAEMFLETELFGKINKVALGK